MKAKHQCLLLLLAALLFVTPLTFAGAVSGVARVVITKQEAARFNFGDKSWNDIWAGIKQTHATARFRGPGPIIDVVSPMLHKDPKGKLVTRTTTPVHLDVKVKPRDVKVDMKSLHVCAVTFIHCWDMTDKFIAGFHDGELKAKYAVPKGKYILRVEIKDVEHSETSIEISVQVT